MAAWLPARLISTPQYQNITVVDSMLQSCGTNIHGYFVKMVRVRFKLRVV